MEYSVLNISITSTLLIYRKYIISKGRSLLKCNPGVYEFLQFLSHIKQCLNASRQYSKSKKQIDENVETMSINIYLDMAPARSSASLM